MGLFTLIIVLGLFFILILCFNHIINNTTKDYTVVVVFMLIATAFILGMIFQAVYNTPNPYP